MNKVVDDEDKSKATLQFGGREATRCRKLPKSGLRLGRRVKIREEEWEEALTEEVHYLES